MSGPQLGKKRFWDSSAIMLTVSGTVGAVKGLVPDASVLYHDPAQPAPGFCLKVGRR